MKSMAFMSLIMTLIPLSLAQAKSTSVLVSYGNDVCVDLIGDGALEDVDYSTDYKCPGLELSGAFNLNTDTSYSIGIDQKTGEDAWEELQLIYNNSLLTIGQGSTTGDVWRDIETGGFDHLRAEWLITNKNRDSKPFAVIFRQFLLSKGGEAERFHVVFLNQEQSCLVNVFSSYKEAKSKAVSLENKSQVSCKSKAVYLN